LKNRSTECVNLSNKGCLFFSFGKLLNERSNKYKPECQISALIIVTPTGLLSPAAAWIQAIQAESGIGLKENM